MPIVDWLNLTPSSTPSKIDSVLIVEASPKPDPTNTSLVSASTNLICNPNLVV